jgi:hypothetical protein
LGKEEEADKSLFKNYYDENTNFDHSKSYKEIILNLAGITTSEEEEEERNDVYIYKTLRYPPKSTPPTID